MQENFDIDEAYEEYLRQEEVIKMEPSKASHKELCEQALRYYEEIVKEVCHWNSLIPKAIEFYRKYGKEAK